MKRIMVVMLAVFLACEVSVKCQDEQPGQIVTISAAVPAGGFNCHGDPFYCYGVPYTSNSNPQMQGMFWSDFFGQKGFIISLNGSWDLGQVIIDSTTPTYDDAGRLNSLSFTFHGTATDDGGSYSGNGKFVFTNSAYRCRYGTCYNYYMQSGSGLQVTYN